MKPSRATLNTHRSTEGAQNKKEISITFGMHVEGKLTEIKMKKKKPSIDTLSKRAMNCLFCSANFF